MGSWCWATCASFFKTKRTLWLARIPAMFIMCHLSASHLGSRISGEVQMFKWFGFVFISCLSASFSKIWSKIRQNKQASVSDCWYFLTIIIHIRRLTKLIRHCSIIFVRLMSSCSTAYHFLIVFEQTHLLLLLLWKCPRFPVCCSEILSLYFVSEGRLQLLCR